MFTNKEELHARLQTSCDTAFNSAMRSLAPWPYRMVGDLYGGFATMIDAFTDGVAETTECPEAVEELRKTSAAFRKARNCFWRRDWRAARRALKEVSD